MDTRLINNIKNNKDIVVALIVNIDCVCDQVRIPDCPGPERIMSLGAGSCEAVAGVLQMAIPFMYEQGR